MNDQTKPTAIATIPVLVLDADNNFKKDPVIQQQFIDQVKAFIELCCKK